MVSVWWCLWGVDWRVTVLLETLVGRQGVTSAPRAFTGKSTPAPTPAPWAERGPSAWGRDRQGTGDRSRIFMRIQKNPKLNKINLVPSKTLLGTQGMKKIQPIIRRKVIQFTSTQKRYK